MESSSMLFGTKEKFAIESEVWEIHDNGQVFGRLVFWVDGKLVGDPEDAAYLLGCKGWMQDFLEKPRNRYDPLLDGRPIEEIFKLVHTAVFSGVAYYGIKLDKAASRFHIAHLGMSTFDRFDLALVEEAPGGDHLLIWREGDDGPLHCGRLGPNDFRDAVAACLAWMETAF